MIASRYLLLSLALAACATAAYGLGRRSRHVEKHQLEEGLRNWEDEGGNLAPPIDRVVASTAVHPGLAPTP